MLSTTSYGLILMLPAWVSSALGALTPVAVVMGAGFLYLLCRHFVTGAPIAAKHVRRVVVVGAVLLALEAVPFVISVAVWAVMFVTTGGVANV